MFKARTHGGLSGADYALLHAAMKRPGIDIMTEDKPLRGSTGAERGPKAKGRILHAMSIHDRGRKSTAWVIRQVFAGHIEKEGCIKPVDLPGRTEFWLEGKKILAIDRAKDGDVQVCLGPAAGGKKDGLKKLGILVQKHFFEWRPSRDSKGPMTGTTKKKDLYSELQDRGDGIDGLTSNVVHKLQKKNLDDLDL